MRSIRASNAAIKAAISAPDEGSIVRKMSTLPLDRLRILRGGRPSEAHSTTSSSAPFKRLASRASPASESSMNADGNLISISAVSAGMGLACMDDAFTVDLRQHTEDLGLQALALSMVGVWARTIP